MNSRHIGLSPPWRFLIFISQLAAISTVHAQSYTFVSLGSLGGNSAASGINDLGQIVGTAYASAAAGGAQYAVIWSGTTPTVLADVSSGSSANGINNAGQIVGASAANGSAVMWNSATAAPQVLSPNYSGAYAIDTAGQAVGFANGPVPTLWSGGTATPLNPTGVGTSGGTVYAINNVGQLAGVSSGTVLLATIWNGTAPSLLPPANPQYYDNQSYAFGINDLGQAVGFTYAGYPGTQCVYSNLVATVWSTGTNVWPANQPITSNPCASEGLTLNPNAVLLYAIGEALNLPTRALAINNAGQVVGWACTTCYQDNLQHAVLWNNSVYPIDLNDFLSTDVLAAGWILWSANAINNNGVIVGQDYNTVSGVYGAYELVPIPVTSVSAPQIAAGQSATLSADPSGSGPFSYQWFQGSSGDMSMPITGATGSSYTTPPLTASANYWVQVTVGSVAEASATIAVTVTPPSSGGGSPSTDGPLPLWSMGVLGALLIGFGSRRMGQSPRPCPHPRP